MSPSSFVQNLKCSPFHFFYFINIIIEFTFLFNILNGPTSGGNVENCLLHMHNGKTSVNGGWEFNFVDDFVGVSLNILFITFGAFSYFGHLLLNV